MPSISAPTLTRSEAKRLIGGIINYPLFMPDLGARVTQFLVSGELALFIEEVKRLSALGSRSASAFLSYLHLKGAVAEAVDLASAETLCSDGARGGDAYSQYAMAWICRAAGNRDAEAMDWMKKAAKGQFVPAIVDAARFLAGGVGVAAADTEAALGLLRDAHWLGHRMALVYIAELLRKKPYGLMRRICGACLYPFAIGRATRFTNRYPLSDRGFVTSLSTKLPLFNGNVHAFECRQGSSDL